MYQLRILKRNVLGNLEYLNIPLPEIEKILTQGEIFTMEFKLNELQGVRFHIETVEDGDGVLTK